MSIKTICLALISLVTISAHAAAPPPSTCPTLPPDVQQKIHDAVDATRVADKISGVTFAVFSDSCILAQGQAGTSTPAGGAISAEETIFRQASISKLFTDISISQLIEQGRLKRDQSVMALNNVPIFDYIRENDTGARIDQWSKITIGHMMSHQAGISKDLPGAMVFFNSEDLNKNAYPSMDDLYNGILDVEFLFSAGQTNGIKYSNLAVNLLARVVESSNVQGLDFQEYVHEHIAKRIGANIYYDIPKNKRSKMIQGYGSLLKDGSRTVVPNAYFVGSYDGSIGVASTAVDMSKFGMDLLKMMRGESQLLHNEQVITDFFNPVSKVSPTQAWAGGAMWDVMPGETANDPLWVGHTGTGASERLILMVSPERGIGVSVMLNSFDASREKYVKMIADLTSTAKRQLTPIETARISAARAFLNATPVPQNHIPVTKADPADLQKFTGNFFADVPGEMAATVSSDGYLTFLGQKLEVDNIQEGRFRMPLVEGASAINWNREPVVFEFDSNGAVTGIRTAQVGIWSKR